jgi:heme exporter protein D
MPLVTGLLNEYANAPAVMTYATVMTLAALALLGMWLHAEHRGLVSDLADQRERAERTSRLVTIAAVFAVSIPVALPSPRLAQYLWILILLFRRIGPLLRRLLRR